MKKVLILIKAVLFIGVAFILSTCSDEQDRPNLKQLTPSTGKEGDVVVISGSLLGTTQKINFGTVEALPIDPQAGEVTTQVPANVPLGKVSVTVQTKGGVSNALEFLVIPPAPDIQSLTPEKASSGMTLTLSGKYFSTATEVLFGTQKVTQFQSKTDTEIKLVVPDGLPLGAIDISITNEGGTSDKATFTVVGKPSITEFSPLAGPVGTHVFVTGTNFEETTDVYFGEVKGTFEIKNATLIDAVVPATAASGKLKISTAGGDALSTTDFIVKGAPANITFSPSSGAVGTEITINGQNFSAPNAKVRFGGILASVVNVVSDTQIKVKVPSGAASGKISVETAAGTGSSGANFTVTGAPTITSFSPTSGITGTSVVINGSNFINVSSVKFNGTEVGTSNFTVNATNKITATVPSGTSNGVITVTTPGGTGSSATNFTIIGLPSITSFNPTSGAVGTDVVITGTSLGQVSAVKFNNVAATTFTVNSATQITAKVPAGATTGKLSVTNVAGTMSSATDFTVIQVPFISSISPTSGVVGSTVTITGTNLLFSSSNGKVNFGTTQITNVTSNTGTEIKFIIPSDATPGSVNVSVVTPGGTSNSKSFNLTPPPVITSLKPNQSYKGFPIMLIGTGLKNATSVKIGSTNATILTNYNESSIIMIPTSITNGVYDVTLTNANGISAAVKLTIVTAPSGVGSPPGASVVSPPPTNYVNAVSNQWSLFLLSVGSGACTLVDLNDDTFCGSYKFSKDGSGKVVENYMEFHRGTGANVEYFYGQWSATAAQPCTQKLVFISAKDGHIETATVSVGDADGNSFFYPSGTCSN